MIIIIIIIVVSIIIIVSILLVVIAQLFQGTINMVVGPRPGLSTHGSSVLHI